MLTIINDNSLIVIVPQFDIHVWIIPICFVVRGFGRYILRFLKQYLRRSKKKKRN